MYRLYRHGTADGFQDLPSLADGLTGTAELDSVTIPIVKRHVDEIVLVSEDEIARAIAFAWHEYSEVIEGSGAVTLAALLSGKVTGRPAMGVITGGNIDPELHAEIAARHAMERRA